MNIVQVQTNNLSIELLRGIAAVMVMLCHYASYVYGIERTWMSFLYTGVDFFFVISGFVFAPTLLAPGRENMVAFIIRRVFRIYPLFLFAIILYAFLPEKIWNVSVFLQHVFFLHTTTSKEIAFYYNPAFWSLPVEIEFYLLVSLLVFLKIRNAISVLAVLFCLPILIRMLLHNIITDSSNIKIITAHLPYILPEFLLGTFAYIVTSKVYWVYGTFLGIAGLLLLLVLGRSFVIYGDNMHIMTYGFFTFLCALGYQWIIIATVTLSNQTQYFVKFNLLSSLLGNLSYGVYLFHNAIPAILKLLFDMENFVLFIASVLLTNLFSGVMYIVLEHPAREFGRRYSGRYYRAS